MDSTDGLVRGMAVKNTGAPITMPVGPEVLGRILNVVGEPVDERGPVNAKKYLPDPPRARRSSSTSRSRSRCSRPASRSSTCSRPTAAAARSACSAAPASARPCSSWSSSTTSPRSTAASRCFAGVGERTREGNDLYHEMEESKLETGEPVLSKTALVYGQMNEPPGARARVALSALTVAEYFRDEEGQDVLLFVDNIFRFTQAGSEVSALLGRIPSAVGYQPTLSTEMGELQERITSTNKGSITSVQAIYVPADDLTDPAPATAFAHLDATTVLSRAISEIGIYPAVDPLDSTSTILSPAASSARSTTTSPARCSACCSATRTCRTSSPSSAWTSSREDDKLVGRARPQDPALPVAAVLRRRDVHRRRRASTSSSRTPSAASGRSSTASTTTCPSRRSTWSAASRRRVAKAEQLAQGRA